MKKKLALLLASSIVLTTLAACGNGNNSKTDNPEWKGSVAMVMPGLITRRTVWRSPADGS